MRSKNTISSITFSECKTLAIVIFVAICGTLGIDIHLASMPHIMIFMHTNKAHMQQSVSLFLLGLGVSLLFYGPLSDKYGRKPIVIFGLLVAAIFSFTAAYTTNIHAFLFTRFMQGFGSGVCAGLGRTIVADVLQGERFAIIGSYFSMFISLSPLFAPALGGYIQHWFGWQANFIVLGSILLVGVLLYAFFCPETNHFKNPDACKPKTLFENYHSLLTHPIFVGFTLITGIAMAANMVYATMSSFIFQSDFHLNPIQYGWVTAIVGVGGIIGKLINPISIKKIGGLKTLRLGLVLILLSGIWIGLFLITKMITISLVMIAVFITILGQSFINPTSASKALSMFHTKRGAAGALYGSFQMVTAFVASAIVGALTQDGLLVMSIAYILLALAGLLIYAKLSKK